MSDYFEECLDKVLKHEGGFVNHPSDPGGMTNLGVTKKVYENWVGREVNKQDMMALTADDVKPIYHKNYWQRCKCDELPIGVDYVVFDMSVNHGVGRASRFLQKIVGATIDGAIGNETLSKVKEMPRSEIVNKLCLQREKFYKKLKTFDVFGKGWLRRNEEVKQTAEELLT
tara:strand:- start:901 stop:1413 length:513 start_codon:yes stop_codon:yes gene_type:complete